MTKLQAVNRMLEALKQRPVSALDTGGTSAGTEPTWPTRVGWLVADGGATWQAVRSSGTLRNVTAYRQKEPLVWTGGLLEGVHYEVRSDLARPALWLMTGGTVTVLHSSLIPGGGTYAVEAPDTEVFNGANLYLPGGTAADVSTIITNPNLSGF
jgi:hypothetical protein